MNYGVTLTLIEGFRHVPSQCRYFLSQSHLICTFFTTSFYFLICFLTFFCKNYDILDFDFFFFSDFNIFVVLAFSFGDFLGVDFVFFFFTFNFLLLSFLCFLI